MLLFCDSFDHYATADLLSKWTSKGTSYVTIDSGTGRNSTNALKMSGASSAMYLSKNFSSTATLIAHFAFKLTGYNANTTLATFYDGSTCHCDVRLDSGNYLAVTRNGTTLETSTIIPSLNVWYHIQIKLTIADSPNGIWEIKLNNVTIMSGSGDTRNGGNASVDSMALTTPASGSARYFDDVVICNDAGSYNNNFLGDVRVYYSPPTADGSNTAWTASAGTDEECVDESSPNSDTDYISSSTPGQVDSFTFDALGITASVKALQTLLFARKDDAGSRTIREYCKSGGSGYQGTEKSLLDSYLYFTEIREVDPATSSPWSVSGVDAAELGVELVS